MTLNGHDAHVPARTIQENEVETAVFLAILVAGFMHAGWNALIKVGLDRFSSLLLIVLVQMALSLILLPFFAFPVMASWPWILASAIIHTAYKLSLISAYEHGDLSQVYPLARGSAPLIVALASVPLLGESLPPSKMLAIASIGLGVCLMSLRGGVNGRMPAKAFGLALVTAGCTASYTLVDGVGARLSESASGFILVTTLIDGVFTCAYSLAKRGPKAFIKVVPAWRSGVIAGTMSLASYWIAIWAFTKAPIALVAALRETSVLMALLIAVIFLKERTGPSRIAAASLITGGVVLMRL
ncbi:EamA family transporter [Microvirga sp. ACRRW]|uniref:EamA family transporter n=1 Tax=Microvirga sp. ACRRW TaxID=2918205 RepID=UPI001EF4532A|nr:EamA family transporter [Microvirga sp. ACRRW]MCG7391983.1 EamA family transporter [Microvirga sp. ACRRW]